jgi:hypothetical protein
LGFFYAKSRIKLAWMSGWSIKKLTQPKVALQGFALAQCVRDAGGVKRSRQSQMWNVFGRRRSETESTIPGLNSKSFKKWNN